MIYIGFGSDTDCDGTSYYIIALNAQNSEDAWNFVRSRGSMTTDGIHEIQPAYAVMDDLQKYNVKKSDIFEVIEENTVREHNVKITVEAIS